jgi:hypothetical protein
MSGPPGRSPGRALAGLPFALPIVVSYDVPDGRRRADVRAGGEGLDEDVRDVRAK